MKLDLTDLKVRDDGEETCLQCPVKVLVRHGLSPNLDKEDHPLGRIRDAVFLSLDACIGLGNCVRECNESLASDLCRDVSKLSLDILGDSEFDEEHPIIKASERASSFAQWVTPEMSRKIEARERHLFSEEEKTRMHEWMKLSGQHMRRGEALRKYLVTVSNPFKIKQIRRISLVAIQRTLEEAGVDYSNDVSDNVVSAHGTTWEDDGRRMIVKIGE
ncbi:MAG: hypothetical protein ACD_71C00182G0002 [uncultured bacterium (gcode 4)]|uniref:Uncharacterized protein n=1 Tax=uncultured bacterium (gcode 4) TaxID=1234023 RepID=K1Z4U3_9BACT|nr:MAG: hypothetical protein ACD_71C00182G0002 [uncultured bacterium (gcode 4)]